MSVGRHSFYNLAGAVIPLVLALVTIPLYVGLIGVERYGVLAIVWLILGYFGLFDLGLGRAVAQRIAVLASGSAAQRASVFWTAAVANLVIGLFGGVLLMLCAPYFFLNHFQARPELLEEALAAVPWLAMAVPLATLTGVASGALQGRQKFLDVNIASTIGASLFQLLPLVFASFAGSNLTGLIVTAMLGRVIGLSVFLYRAHAHLLKGVPIRIAHEEWARLLKFGGWITVVSIVSPLLVVVDRFFIGALISAVAVAIYAIAFEIVQRISILPRSVALALFPRMAEASTDVSRELAERALRGINLIVTPVAIAGIFGISPFLSLWIGADIGNQTGPIAIVVLFGFWANAFGIVPYNRLQATGKPRLVALALLAQVPFYLIAIYYAVSSFGLWGAAATFALRTVIDSLVLHRVSSGGWALPSTISSSGVLMIGAMISNLVWEAFSIAWFFAAAIIAAAFMATSMRHVPSEFETIASRWMPSSIFGRIRFV